MLTEEEHVEAVALHRRGWSIAAIARHLGRDRKTVRAYLRAERTPGVRRRSAPDHFAPFVPYLQARLADDPHVWASALYDEALALGYPRSYVTFARELRRRALRPRCPACAGVRGRPTIEIDHPPGEEIQWDWLELPGAPWGGDAHLLVGTLSHSGKCRAAFAEEEDQPHLVEAADAVLRRLGGTARRWRFDRTASVCDPDSGRLRQSFAQVARHYGVGVDVCGAYRANRKGAVESRNHFIAQRFWRTLVASSMQEAQAKLDRFLERVGDARRRGRRGTVADAARAERLLALPQAPFPATIQAERVVSRSALVSYQGNRYSLPPGLEGQRVRLRHRLGEREIEIVSAAGGVLARHVLAPPGVGALRRTPAHHQALEEAVLAATAARSGPPCRRKQNRPPGPLAQQAASALRGEAGGEVVVDLADWAMAAAGAAR
jgi:transposase